MKRKIGTYPYLYPVPIVLIGTIFNKHPNYTTVGDVAIMGIGEPLVCISLGETSLARNNILESGIFSINIPNVSLLSKVDFCGMKSGSEYKKESLFTTVYGDNPNIPLITECPVNMECTVVHSYQFKNRHIFIAHILQTHVDEGFTEIVDDKIKIKSLTELQPIIYALDNKYYSIGKIIGTGYAEGKSLINETPKRTLSDM